MECCFPGRWGRAHSLPDGASQATVPHCFGLRSHTFSRQGWAGVEGWNRYSGIHYYMLLRAGGRLRCFCVWFHIVVEEGEVGGKSKRRGAPAEAAGQQHPSRSAAATAQGPTFDAENCPKIASPTAESPNRHRRGKACRSVARDGAPPCCQLQACQDVGRPTTISIAIPFLVDRKQTTSSMLD